MTRCRGTSRALQVVSILAFASVGLGARQASAMLNPDTVYCHSLGYTYITALTNRGTIGVCQMPDGQLFNASDFYHGRVGLEFSYCATRGLVGKHQTDGQICGDCLVCVKEDGEKVEAVAMMRLSVAESKCGDGHCGTLENTGNCPDDCPAGGVDDYCDGLEDEICDPDCTNMGQEDVDCNAADGQGGSGCGCEVRSGRGAGASEAVLLVLLGLAAILGRGRGRLSLSKPRSARQRPRR